MKVLLRSAAESGGTFWKKGYLASVSGQESYTRLTFSQPKTTQSPGGSISKMTLAAFEDHGRWAPTKAQAIPSRRMYLARVLTDSGIDERVTESIQRQSLPVGPDGSIGCLDSEAVVDISFTKDIKHNIKFLS